MHNQPAETAKQTQVVFHDGRALTSEEALGVDQPAQSWRKAFPLLLSGWLGLLLVIADPVFGVITMVAAPMILARMTSAQRD